MNLKFIAIYLFLIAVLLGGVAVLKFENKYLEARAQEEKTMIFHQATTSTPV